MKIGAPQIDKRGNELIVSAQIEFSSGVLPQPERLWYAVPLSQEALLSDKSDTFATASMLMAMALGEDLEIEGAISTRLAHGLREFQRFYVMFYPDKFRVVTVNAERYLSDQHVSGTGVGSAFSGGVDSFFTLLEHSGERELLEASRITHALFIHGFDIPLGDTKTYDIARAEYERLMDSLGIRFLLARTNFRDFRIVDWPKVFGSALIAVAHLYSKGLSRFYVPSALTYLELDPDGADHRLDHWLSTDSMEVMHDGAGVNRIDKTAAIANWPEAFERLRVCWIQPDGLRNCCRCPKCIRTMLVLELYGGLEHFKTFPLPLTNEAIRSCLPSSREYWLGQTLRLAEDRGRTDIAQAMRYSISRVKRLDRWDAIRNHIGPFVRPFWHAIRHRISRPESANHTAGPTSTA